MNNEMKDTNPKDAIGVKKWRQFTVVPMQIVWELGVAMLEGALKYGRHNYRASGVRASVYVDAALGHIESWFEGQDLDPDTRLSHITKAMASLAVLRDAEMNNFLEDDRPPKVDVEGHAARLQGIVDDMFEKHADKNPHHYTHKNDGAPYLQNDLCEDEGCEHHGTPHVCVNDFLNDVNVSKMEELQSILADLGMVMYYDNNMEVSIVKSLAPPKDETDVWDSSMAKANARLFGWEPPVIDLAYDMPEPEWRVTTDGLEVGKTYQLVGYDFGKEVDDGAIYTIKRKEEPVFDNFGNRVCANVYGVKDSWGEDHSGVLLVTQGLWVELVDVEEDDQPSAQEALEALLGGFEGVGGEFYIAQDGNRYVLERKRGQPIQTMDLKRGDILRLGEPTQIYPMGTLFRFAGINNTGSILLRTLDDKFAGTWIDRYFELDERVEPKVAVWTVEDRAKVKKVRVDFDEEVDWWLDANPGWHLYGCECFDDHAVWQFKFAPLPGEEVPDWNASEADFADQAILANAAAGRSKEQVEKELAGRSAIGNEPEWSTSLSGVHGHPMAHEWVELKLKDGSTTVSRWGAATTTLIGDEHPVMGFLKGEGSDLVLMDQLDIVAWRPA